MKVLFVYYDAIAEYRGYRGKYYTGIGSISAILKENGFQTSLLHIVRPINKREFLRRIEREQPQLLAFSATTNVFPFIGQLSQWAKESFDIFQVCGGSHAILNPDLVFRNSSVDAVCIGEGEYAVLDLARHIRDNQDINFIDGLWVKTDGHINRNRVRNLLDLNELPYPDKEIFNYSQLENAIQKKGVFMASRGCPYNCSYCCNRSIMSQLGASPEDFIRFKSVDYIIAEIQNELKKYPFVEHIHFDDDILVLRMDWFEEFVKRYKKEINLPYECNLRPELADNRVINLLKESGCDKALIGIESGNEDVRKNILNRDINDRFIADAFSELKRNNISTFSFNMVGFPNETIAQMLDTVKMNARLSVDQCQISIFYPYKKTSLYETCQQNGLISGKTIQNYFSDSVLNFGYIKKNQILFIKNYFRLLILSYKKIARCPRKISKLLTTIMDRLLSAKITAVLIYPIYIFLFILVKRRR